MTATETPAIYRQCAEEFLVSSYPGHIKDVTIHQDFTSDVFRLIIRTNDGRAYLHPRFATVQEVMERNIPNFAERLVSTMEGNPRTKFPHSPMTSAEFSLNELEEAEKLVNECQSR